MSEVTRRMIARVAVDIAKQVIHVHAFDGAGAQPRQPRPTPTPESSLRRRAFEAAMTGQAGSW